MERHVEGRAGPDTREGRAVPDTCEGRPGPDKAQVRARAVVGHPVMMKGPSASYHSSNFGRCIGQGASSTKAAFGLLLRNHGNTAGIYSSSSLMSKQARSICMNARA